MVNGALFISGSVGVLLSAVFVFFEVGRFAEPQVPRSLFDERKLFIGYTVGLFGGVVLSIPLGLFLTSLTGGTLFWALIGLVALVLGMEFAQILLLRTTYFGQGESGPFYALAFRSGASAILVLTIVTLSLGGPSFDAVAFGSSLLESVGVIALEVTGALLALRLPAPRTGATGGPLSSGLVTGAGLFFLGVGSLFGPIGTCGTAVVVTAVAARSYLRLRDPILGRVLPPRKPGEEPAPSTPFGRTDR